MTQPLQILALTLMSAAATLAADFFPLQNGNLWVYRESVTGQQLEVRVSTPFVSNDRVYHSVRGFLPQMALMRVNEFNNLVYQDPESNSEPVIAGFTPSRTAYSSMGRQCTTFATTREQREEYRGPAGFWQALVVDYQPFGCADVGETQEWFVENVGMVRRVVTTIAGPRTYELVYARVGNQVISSGETGSFSVSAVMGTDRDSWDVTLRVSPDATPFPVEFPSSQEYDLRLRDSSGRIVWIWSADKLFLQALHTRNLNGYTATVKVPHPPHAPEQAQAYTLEAWLTTSRDQPQFAATTTVRLTGSVEQPQARAASRRR